MLCKFEFDTIHLIQFLSEGCLGNLLSFFMKLYFISWRLLNFFNFILSAQIWRSRKFSSLSYKKWMRPRNGKSWHFWVCPKKTIPQICYVKLTRFFEDLPPLPSRAFSGDKATSKAHDQQSTCVRVRFILTWSKHIKCHDTSAVLLSFASKMCAWHPTCIIIVQTRWNWALILWVASLLLLA